MDKIQFRRDTLANWASANPILAEGEIGYVLDDPNRYKMGDGVKTWDQLPFRGFDGNIVHETGNSGTAVMSQDAVTRELVELGSEIQGNLYTESGKYLDPNGNCLTASGASATTDFIDLENVESIKIKGRSGAYVSLIAFYDENARFISSIYGGEYNNVLVTILKGEIPTNAKYFRATGNGDGKDVLIYDSFIRVEQRFANIKKDVEQKITNIEEDVELLDTGIYKLHGNFYVEKGKYLDPNGNNNNATGASATTDFIDLENIESLKIKGRSGPYVSLIAYYDEDKRFISSIYGKEYNNVLVTIFKSEFPANAKFFRATGNGDDNDVLIFDNFFRVEQKITNVEKDLEQKIKPYIGIKAIATMGASLMYSGNGWVEKGCNMIGAISYNKAVSGERVPYFANQLYNNNYCTDSEFENTDILVIQFSNAGNVYIEDNSLSIEDYELMINNDLDNPFKALTEAQCLDYILKKWQKKCYLQKDNVNSQWYGTQFGKPCNFLFVTHWHDARKSYNDSIRQVAEKWGGGVCEFDKFIGFSKNQPLFDGTQVSAMYAVDKETIDNIVYGWHPLRDENGQKYIQKKMANIFAQSLIKLYSMN